MARKRRFVERDHPRHPAGSGEGGQFREKGAPGAPTVRSWPGPIADFLPDNKSDLRAARDRLRGGNQDVTDADLELIYSDSEDSYERERAATIAGTRALGRLLTPDEIDRIKRNLGKIEPWRDRSWNERISDNIQKVRFGDDEDEDDDDYDGDFAQPDYARFRVPPGMLESYYNTHGGDQQREKDRRETGAAIGDTVTTPEGNGRVVALYRTEEGEGRIAVWYDGLEFDWSDEDDPNYGSSVLDWDEGDVQRSGGDDPFDALPDEKAGSGAKSVTVDQAMEMGLDNGQFEIYDPIGGVWGEFEGFDEFNQVSPDEVGAESLWEVWGGGGSIHFTATGDEAIILRRRQPSPGDWAQNISNSMGSR